MPSTYSDLKIQLMATGENNTTWGDITNLNLEALEDAIAGSADVTFASANITLTLTDVNTPQTARNLRLRCTGTTGGSSRNLNVPAIEKPYIVRNDCGDSIVVKTLAGSGITVAPGRTMWLYSDGVNVVDVVTQVSSLNLSTPLPVTSGGTGVTTSTGTGSVVLSNSPTFVGPITAGDVNGVTLFMADSSAIRNTASAGNTMYFDSGVGAGSTTGDFQFRSTASFTTRLYINGATGNVGIGTVSPAAKLDVSSSGFNIVASRSTGGYAAFQRLAPAGQAAHDFYTINGVEAGRITVDGSNIMAFSTGSATTERMRIDGSGNVGIGTSNPEGLLDVTGTTIARGGANGFALFAPKPGTSPIGANYDRFWIRVDPSDQVTTIGNTHGGTGSPRALAFLAANSERMRIDTAGNLLVGKTTASSGTAGFVASATGMSATNDSAEAANFNRQSSDGDLIQLRRGATQVGSISVTTTATAYNTSSDARLKENIAPADDAAALIDAIQVRKFDWKADGSHQRHGMVAQELLEVAPEAVSVPADEDQMLAIDYSKLVPMLIKEVQSLRARVAQLEGN